RAYAAFKSWLASATCVSIPSSTGSWNIFHQGPRTCASAGSADFQPPDSLYVAAAAALSGVLYAGANEQALKPMSQTAAESRPNIQVFPGALACAAEGVAIRTCTPSAIESGGLSTTVSFGSSPDNTSIVLPKSRPWTMLLSFTRCPPSNVATCRPAARNNTVL